jgi:hypothetical protein
VLLSPDVVSQLSKQEHCEADDQHWSKNEEYSLFLASLDGQQLSFHQQQQDKRNNNSCKRRGPLEVAVGFHEFPHCRADERGHDKVGGTRAWIAARVVTCCDFRFAGKEGNGEKDRYGCDIDSYGEYSHAAIAALGETPRRSCADQVSAWLSPVNRPRDSAPGVIG